MAAIDDLPEELIIAVCEQLILIAGNQELTPLLTANKRFYRIVHPLFWRDVYVPDRCYSHRAFCAFAVLRASKVAPLIRTIRIDAMGTRGYEDADEGLHKKKGLRDESVLSSLADRTDEIFSQDDDKRDLWRTKVWEQNTDYMIPLFLVHLPNLERLRMTSCTVDMEESELWPNTGDIVAHMLADSQLAEDQQPFRRLRKVFIDGPTGKYGLYSTALATATTWPVVESVHAVHAADEHDDYMNPLFAQLAPRSSNLSTVNLFPNCKLSGKHLQHFLAASRNLRTFRYHMGQPWAWLEFRTSDLQKALNPHKKTLENIALCIDSMEFESGTQTQLHPPVDFRAFDKLVQLCVGLPFLFDRRIEAPGPRTLTNMLPSRIRLLRIVQVEQDGEMRWLESNLKELIQRKKKGMFPDLATVQVSSSENSEGPMDRQQHNSARTRLTDLFRGSGIEMRLFLNKLDPFARYTRWDIASGIGLHEEEVAYDGAYDASPESSDDEDEDEDEDGDGDGDDYSGDSGDDVDSEDDEDAVVGLATFLED